MQDEAEERKLIRASQNGDADAFEVLVRDNQKMLHSLTFRMSGSWSEAEDLAQEAFLQAWRRLGSFRAEARFSSWLYRIAVNQCLNWKKRAVLGQKVHEEWGKSELNAPEEHVAAHQIRDALLELPPKQRAAIILTTYDGFNHAEAAQMMGCSETTVSWYLFRARARLKTILLHLRTAKEEK